MARGRWKVVETPEPEQPAQPTPAALDDLEAQVERELKELKDLEAKTTKETRKEKLKREFFEAKEQGKHDSGRYRKMLLEEINDLKKQIADAKKDIEIGEMGGFKVIVPKGWQRPLSQRDVVIVLTVGELRILERALKKWSGSGLVDPDVVEAGGSPMTLLDYFELCSQLSANELWPEQFAHVGNREKVQAECEEYVRKHLEEERIKREKRSYALDQIESGSRTPIRKFSRSDAEAWAKAAGSDVETVIANNPLFAHLRS